MCTQQHIMLIPMNANTFIWSQKLQSLQVLQNFHYVCESCVIKQHLIKHHFMYWIKIEYIYKYYKFCNCAPSVKGINICFGFLFESFVNITKSESFFLFIYVQQPWNSHHQYLNLLAFMCSTQYKKKDKLIKYINI